jgi:hypothetical protein
MDGATIGASGVIGTVPPPWTVAGVADFNGDGRSDILWRNTSTGQVAIWFMNGLTVTTAAVVGTVAASWSIAATGNFNTGGVHGGNLDRRQGALLWRDTATGAVAIWFFHGVNLTIESTANLGAVPTNWVIQNVNAN